jgi:hypothetical protein
VLAQKPGVVVVAEMSQRVRRTLDVGEEECHRPVGNSAMSLPSTGQTANSGLLSLSKGHDPEGDRYGLKLTAQLARERPTLRSCASGNDERPDGKPNTV